MSYFLVVFCAMNFDGNAADNKFKWINGSNLIPRECVTVIFML
jgi:hypothetical protein